MKATRYILDATTDIRESMAADTEDIIAQMEQEQFDREVDALYDEDDRDEELEADFFATVRRYKERGYTYSDLEFLSDWGKDVFGYRPRGIIGPMWQALVDAGVPNPRA